MIFLKKKDFLNPFYSFNDYENQIETNLSIKILKDIKEEILVHNPSYDELRMLNDLDKKVVLIMYNIKTSFLPLIKSNNVDKILIYDKTDEILLNNNRILKYKLFNPIADKIENNKKNDFLICYNSVFELSFEDIEFLLSISNHKRLIYKGLKRVNNDYDFKKLLMITNNLNIDYWPILYTKESIASSQHIISFLKRNTFPILESWAITNDVLVLFYSDQYYNFLLAELFNKSYKQLEEYFKNEVIHKEIIKKQKEKIEVLTSLDSFESVI